MVRSLLLLLLTSLTGTEMLGSLLPGCTIKGLPVMEMAISPPRGCRFSGMGPYGSTLGVIGGAASRDMVLLPTRGVCTHRYKRQQLKYKAHTVRNFKKLHLRKSTLFTGWSLAKILYNIYKN